MLNLFLLVNFILVAFVFVALIVFVMNGIAILIKVPDAIRGLNTYLFCGSMCAVLIAISLPWEKSEVDYGVKDTYRTQDELILVYEADVGEKMREYVIRTSDNYLYNASNHYIRVVNYGQSSNSTSYIHRKETIMLGKLEVAK